MDDHHRFQPENTTSRRRRKRPVSIRLLSISSSKLLSIVVVVFLVSLLIAYRIERSNAFVHRPFVGSTAKSHRPKNDDGLRLLPSPHPHRRHSMKMFATNVPKWKTQNTTSAESSVGEIPAQVSTIVATTTTNNDNDNGAQQQMPIYDPTTNLTMAQLDENIFKFNKFVIDTVYTIICVLYPVTGTSKRDYARFFVLETVARVPYFAYLSVLHLRETFGTRYNSMSDQMRTHYAQADNELHHLLIMESLGGNDNPIDRFVAQMAAFIYYWYVIVIYSISEPAAYHLSELIEDHAYDTYNNFITDHADMLKEQPVPDIARKYYERDNQFLFDLYCTVQDQEDPDPNEDLYGVVVDNDDNKDKNRRYVVVNQRAIHRNRKLDTLYDVFRNIRDDEKEHWKTLCNLVQYNDMNAVDGSHVKSTEPIQPTISVTSEIN